jgi:hypothetical protein
MITIHRDLYSKQPILNVQWWFEVYHHWHAHLDSETGQINLRLLWCEFTFMWPSLEIEEFMFDQFYS